jgi:hypothetical protein
MGRGEFESGPAHGVPGAFASGKRVAGPPSLVDSTMAGSGQGSNAPPRTRTTPQTQVCDSGIRRIKVGLDMSTLPYSNARSIRQRV